MCGRLNVSDHPGVQVMLERLGMSLSADQFLPRYNVAPSAPLWVADSGKTLSGMVWGIRPAWAKDDPYKRLINAKAETVWDKPSFRALVRDHRCIVPATGFYEWKREGARKQPFYFSDRNGGALALAAIFRPGDPGEVCLLTTEANDLMAQVHGRMPVVLPFDGLDDWLASGDRATLDALMRPAPEDDLTAYPVSSFVNNAKNDGPACMAPI